MSLSLVTPPAIEPITLTEAKLHLRVDVTDDDALITSLIVAAREQAETFTRRAFLTQTWDLKLDGFPVTVDVPLPPLQSISTLSYLDGAGASQTLALTTGYIVDAPVGPYADHGRVTHPYGIIWPITQRVQNSVTLRFVAGYGATAASVPDSIKAAIKLTVGHLYANRENVVITARGSIVAEMPQASEAILWRYRDMRF